MSSVSGSILHNHQRDLEAIADDYKDRLQDYADGWLAHALQKDAVQNGWDAKLSKKGWSFSIGLVKVSNITYLEIVDHGTSGLTGSIWATEKEQLSLMSDSDATENLAFFLSSNFSGKDSGSGGKRGRGKSLFLYASQDFTFYFESLRKDDIRVYGGQWLTADKKINYELTSDHSNFESQIGGSLKPLNETGTRILIKNPRPEVLKALDNGSLKSYIENTWWEIIKKADAKISVNGQLAVTPDWYIDKPVTSQHPKRVRQEFKDVSFKVRSGETYRIKRIVFDYLPEEKLPMDIKGIAIQRKGMTIERRAAENLVREEGMQKVYGWVEMDKALEEAMYDLENVQHLGFDWVSHPARALKDVIVSKLREFAKDIKLIESELSNKHKANKEIEKEAARKINNYITSLGFKGNSPGPRPTTTGDTKGKKPEAPLRMSLSDFKLPKPASRRIDYGESLIAKAKLINNLEKPVKLRFGVWIEHNGTTVLDQHQDVELASGDSVALGWDNLVASKEIFPTGEYSFRAKFLVLEETGLEVEGLGKIEKGLERKEVIAFSVDQDHKPAGLIKFEGVTRPNNKSKYFDYRPEDQTIVIEYNMEHPYVAEAMARGTREKSTEPLGKLFLEVGMIVAMNQILAEDLALKDPTVFKDVIKAGSNPADALPAIMEKVSQFMWNQ